MGFSKFTFVSHICRNSHNFFIADQYAREWCSSLAAVNSLSYIHCKISRLALNIFAIVVALRFHILLLGDCLALSALVGYIFFSLQHIISRLVFVPSWVTCAHFLRRMSIIFHGKENLFRGSTLCFIRANFVWKFHKQFRYMLSQL